MDPCDRMPCSAQGFFACLNPRRNNTLYAVLTFLVCTCNPPAFAATQPVDGPVNGPLDGVFHVHPGDSIQETLELAAEHPTAKTVRVHAGTYRPLLKGQAMIWFNARHDGITLEAEGDVILSAANPDIASDKAASYPAVVNHVVYFGDGISRNTVLKGFRITGANHFVTQSGEIEPDSKLPELRKGLFFYADGGAIKIFGRSYPALVELEIGDNYASPCAAGISIEHRGFNDQAVLIRDSIFRNNRAQITGSAVDLLQGSSAVIENSLFVGNISNTGLDYISLVDNEYNQTHGSGAVTVFRDSRVVIRNSTFTDNWNGVDDKGEGNVYENNIFWRNSNAGGPPGITGVSELEDNNLNPLDFYRAVTEDHGTGGVSPGKRFELDIVDASGVEGCFISGEINDLRGTIDSGKNVLGGPDPDFDEFYVPRSPAYVGVGYRPLAGRRVTDRPVTEKSTP